MNGQQRDGAAPPRGYGHPNGDPRRPDVNGTRAREEESEDDLDYTEELPSDEPDLYAILNLTNSVCSPLLFPRLF